MTATRVRAVILAVCALVTVLLDVSSADAGNNWRAPAQQPIHAVA